MSTTMKRISKRELLAYQANIKGSIFRQIRQTFARLKEGGFTQKDWAARIDMDEGQLSRRLRGDYDLKIETLSDLARGLNCRIDVKLAPLTEVSTFKEVVKTASIHEPIKEGNKPVSRTTRTPQNNIVPQAEVWAS